MTDPALAATSPAPIPKLRLHLTYLDGLRGLAAFYVLLYHLYLKVWIETKTHPIGFPLMQFGNLAVDVFIVLSGYCLMLPIVRSANLELSGGVKTFLKRRAWRILPPYYAALAVSVGVLWASQQFNSRRGLVDTSKLFDLSPGSIISHVLLVHNLVPSWTYKIDTPMWSVATEWQIYFLLPALLLPLWKWRGSLPMLGCAWAVGLFPWFFHFGFAESARTWLLGLFALGMAAAAINFPRRPQEWVRLFPWGGVTIGLAVLLLGLLIFDTKQMRSWPIDMLTGILTSAVLIKCTLFRTQQNAQATPLLLRLLESRILVGLGLFSYSLYLIHGPILAILIALIHHRLGANSLTLVMLIIGVPITCLGSFCFYLLFERPFLHIRAAMTSKKSQ